MTIVPPGSDNFSKYYQDYLRQIAPVKAEGAPIDFPARAGQANEMGFLGRTIDILSRPMRIVSNPVMKALELPEKYDELAAQEAAGGDVSLGEKLAPVGSLIAAPFTGFFSDNPDNKPYWADIIEKTSDVANRNNPNYVDFENNVNPVTKGVLGFVGDVALDPLTWVPGAAIAKVLQKGGQLAQGAGKAASKVAQRTAGVASDVGETVADVAASGAKATPEAANVSKAVKASEALDTAAREVPNATGLTKPEATLKSLSEFIKAKEPLRGDMLSWVKGLKEAPSIVPPKVAKNVPTAPKIVGTGEWMKQTLNAILKGDIEDLPIKAVSVGEDTAIGRRASYEEAAKLLPQVTKISDAIRLWGQKAETNPYIKQRLAEAVLTPAFKSYQQSLKVKRPTDFLGRVINDGKTADEQLVEGVTALTALQRLKALEGEALAKAEAIFGPELLADMRNMKTQAFNKFLDDMQRVLDGEGVVPVLGQVNSNTIKARVLELFDITPEIYTRARRAVDGKIDYVAVNGVDSIKTVVDELAQSATWQEAIRNAFLQFVPSYSKEIHVELGTKALTNALNRTLPKLLDEQWVKKNYPELLSDGTYKTDAEYGAGVARKLLEFNEHAQYTVREALSEEVDKIFKGVPARGADNKPLKETIVVNGRRKTQYVYEVEPLIGNKKLGFELAKAKQQWITALSKISDDLLFDKGVPSVLSYEGVVTPLRLTDIDLVLREAFDNLGFDQRWYDLMFYNADSGAAWTKIADAVSKMLAGGTEDDILKLLLDSKRRVGSRTISNWLSGKETFATFGHVPFGPRAKSKKLPASTDEIRYRMNDEGTGYFYEWSNRAAAARLATAITDSREALERIALMRRQDLIAKVGSEIETMAPNVAKELVDMFKTPKRAAEAIRATAFVGDMVKDFARVLDALESSAVGTAGVVKNTVGERLVEISKRLNELAEGVVSGDAKKVAKSRKKLSEQSDNVVRDYDEGMDKLVRDGDIEADPQTKELLKEGAEEVRDNNRSTSGRKEQSQGYAEVNAGRRSFLDPLNKAFNGRYGMNTKEFLWGWMTFHGQGITMREFVNSRILGLRELARTHSSVMPDGKTTILTEAFRYLQMNEIPTGTNKALLAAYNDLEKYLAPLFDLSGDAANTLLGNAFFRTGAGVEYLNRLMETYKVLGDTEGVAKLPIGGVFYDIDKANKAVIKSKGKRSLLEEAADQWRTWQIDDPIQFIGRLNAALGKAASDVAFVDKFVNKIPDELVSRTPVDGFVPLLGDGKNYFGDLVSGVADDVYVHPDIAEVFRNIDRVAGETRNISGGLGNFVNRYLDPVTNTWKYAITLPRPGHHFRNLVGDTTFTFIAEGVSNFTRSSRDAFRVMGVRNNYKDVDIIRALVSDGVTKLPRSTDKIVSGKLGNAKFSLTAEEILQAAKDRGLLPPAAVVEDLYDADIVASRFSKALEKGAAVATIGAGARGGQVEQFVMGVSEYRDHFARLQHFIQILHNASEGQAITRSFTNVVKPKTVEELLDVAAERVLKYHPDTSLLSSFEAKYMRRIIPFYSWTRGAVQALAESTVLNPGRIQAINKASYNLAVAMGIDPNALYDPFPQDQLFPSFLTEEMQGPQFEAGGRYYGFSPGIATWDVYNMLGPDPIRGIVGSTNPLLRAPIELLAGSSLGTGARIRDISDYVDSSIPGVNYVSNVSGVSVTGTLASLLSGGGLDAQYQYAAGNKDNTDRAISALNWLTGIGLRDYSRPNYINYAEIEARNKAAEEARNR